MQLRPPEPADEPFLAHVRRPEIAGEFNAFDDPGGERVKADVSRRIIVLDDGTPIGSMSWHGVAYGPYQRSVAFREERAAAKSSGDLSPAAPSD